MNKENLYSGDFRSLDKCYNELRDEDIYKCYSERIN